MLAGKMLGYQHPSEPLYTHFTHTHSPTESGSACLVGEGSAPWLDLQQKASSVLCSQIVQGEANGELIGNFHYKPSGS